MFFFLSLFHCYRKVLPAQTGELNVHFGVFFGGLGDFSEAYLNSVDNFRGCMSDVRKIYAAFFFSYTHFKFITFLRKAFLVFFSLVIFSMHAFCRLISSLCFCYFCTDVHNSIEINLLFLEHCTLINYYFLTVTLQRFKSYNLISF